MATKIGSVYWEASPRLNKLAMAKANEEIRKSVASNAKINQQFWDQDDKNWDNQLLRIRENEKVKRNSANMEKQDLDRQIAGIGRSISAQRSLSDQKEKALASDLRGQSTYETNRRRNYGNVTRDENVLNRLRNHFNQEQNKNSEGFFHRTATNFRTIGTIMRGLAIGSAVFLGFGAIQEALGAIIAAGPIAAAGIALIPVAIAGAVAEGIIFKAAFKGVGSAISDAFDPSKAEQFKKDLQGLSPAARVFVLNLQKIKGAIPNIQQTFFSQKSIGQASSRLRTFALGISKSFTSLVAANGNLFGKLLGTVTSAKGTSEISDFLKNIAKFLRQITPGLTALSSGFITFLDNVSKQLGGNKINQFLINFGKWLAQINTKNLFAAAGAALKGFGQILGSIGGIFSGIVKALGGSDKLGAQFFKNIGGILKTMDAFVNSGTGQKFLSQLFSVLNVLTKLADTAVKSALSFLAGAFSNLYPAIKPVADKLSTIFKLLVPLGPVVGTLASGFLTVANALLGFLIPSLKLAVNLLTAIPPPYLKGIAVALGLIAVAFKAFSIVKGIVVAINEWTKAQLALDIALDANLIALIVVAVAALVVGIIYLATKTKFFQTVWAGLTAAWNATWNVLKGAFSSFLGFFTTGMGKWLLLLLGPVGALATLAIHWKSTWNTIKSVWNGIVSFFTQSIPNFFTKTLPSWFQAGANKVFAVFNDISRHITGWWNNTWNFLTKSIPGFFTKTVPGWFSSGAHSIFLVFNDISRHITGWWNNTWNFLTKSIPGFFTKTVPGWFSSGAHLIFLVFNDISRHVTGWWNNTWNFLTKSVPNFIKGTFVGWFSAARTALSGIWNDVSRHITGWWNNTFNFLTKSVPNFIKKTFTSWFGAARDTLSGVWNDISRHITGWWNNTFNFFNKSVPHFIKVTVPSWFTYFRDKVFGVFNDITNHASGMIKNIINIFKSNWGKMGQAFSGIVNAIAKPVKQLIDIVYTKGIKKFWDAVAKPIGGKVLGALSFINPFASGGLVNAPKFANGGFTGYLPRSLGGPTEDNIPIAVSGGEYVVKARNVRALGPDFLDYLNSNHILNGGRKKLPPDMMGGDVGFRDGGPVGFKVGGGVTQGVVDKTLGWLKGIAGRIPYVLGANGPNAFDCSSLVGNVWARLTGNPINRRYFVTGTEAGWLLGHGFQRGADPTGFTVGLTSPPEHTVGILAGHRFEAAHTGTKMRFDDGATNALGMGQKFHMTGVTGLGGAIGHLTGLLGKIQDMKGQMTAYLQNPVQKLIQQMSFGALPAGLRGQISSQGVGAGLGAQANKIQNDYIKNHQGLATTQNKGFTKYAQGLLNTKIKEAEAAAASFGGAGIPLSVSGSQIAKWISEASKYTNIPASWVAGIETIIRRESGGNPNARNMTDSNARRGDPSIGLMQVIGATFEAYRSKALPDSQINPVANIVAGVNYIRARYGSIFNVQQANPNKPPRGYSIGGPVAKVYDQGGVLGPGQLGINLSSRPERVYTEAQDRNRSGGFSGTIIIDGVDVTSKAHVEENNNKVAISLMRRSR